MLRDILALHELFNLNWLQKASLAFYRLSIKKSKRLQSPVGVSVFSSVNSFRKCNSSLSFSFSLNLESTCSRMSSSKLNSICKCSKFLHIITGSRAILPLLDYILNMTGFFVQGKQHTSYKKRDYLQ